MPALHMPVHDALVRHEPVRIMFTRLALACLLLIGLPVLTACAAATPTTKSGVDKALLGLWTTEANLTRIALTARGEPPESVPIGQWVSFDATGRWFQAAKYITIAIGGVAVEEGSVSAQNGQAKVTGRTESFFPDPGSPQQAKYRTAAPDLSLLYRTATENGEKVLYLKSGVNGTETRYRRCPD